MHRVRPTNRHRAGLGMILGFVLFLPLFNAPTAHAIPAAGDYVFTVGLTGTFTSNGSALTAWNVTDYFNITWQSTNSAQAVQSNNASLFSAVVVTDGVYTFEIQWDAGTYHTIGSINDPDVRFEYAVAGNGAIPEPTSSSLLALGLLVLLGYGWRQRRQAGLQIG